jgi:hypothetical protein
VKTWLHRNPITAAGVVILLLGFGSKFTSGDFQKEQAMSTQLTAQRHADETFNRQLEIAQASRKQREAIANDRYSGCNVVVSTQNTRLLTGIDIGKPVVDGSRPGAFLADGIEVCDQHGLTAVIRNGVAADPVVTTNRQVINAALARFGYDGTAQSKLKYSAPKQ